MQERRRRWRARLQTWVLEVVCRRRYFRVRRRGSTGNQSDSGGPSISTCRSRNSDITDLVVGNGTAGNFAGSGHILNGGRLTRETARGMVTVRPVVRCRGRGRRGVVREQYGAIAGTSQIAASSSPILFDGTPPGVTLATTAPDPDQCRADPLTITFTEPVAGLSNLLTWASSNGSADNFSGSGDAYSVGITPFC